MNNQSSLLLKVLFGCTVACLVAATVLFAIFSFTVGNSGNFLNPNAFGTVIYWILAVAGAMWYDHRFGHSKTTPDNGTGEKTFRLLLAFFIPLLVGMGIALVVYYVFYGLAIALMASLGYIVTVALIAGMLFAVRFLIDIYFKAGNKSRQIRMRVLSLITAIVLLIMALWSSGVTV